MGGGHHLHPGMGRVCVSGGGAGRVLTQAAGLGVEPESEQRFGDQGAGEGDCSAAALAGSGASLGPRSAVRESRVCSVAGGTPDGGEHESAGESV